MTEKEKAFWTWWEQIKDHKDLYNLRMAFDAGFESVFNLIMQLHKPQSSSFDDSECAECSSAEVSIVYPCSTIKSIKKEF